MICRYFNYQSYLGFQTFGLTNLLSSFQESSEIAIDETGEMALQLTGGVASSKSTLN